MAFCVVSGLPTSVVPDWGELALGNIWQGLEGFGLLQLGIGANDIHWLEPGKLLNITQCTGQIPTVQFSSATQLRLTLCDPMNCSTPGLPVHYQLQELTQTHVHQVGDAIQPSHPLLSPSPPAPNPS